MVRLKKIGSDQIRCRHLYSFRESIIKGRINHLTKEIQEWRDQIGKLLQQLDESRNQ